jgi:hypothetical protein
MRIRIQRFDNQKIQKFTTAKLFYFFIKNFNLLFLRPQEMTSKLQENSYLSKDNIQHFKLEISLVLFLPSWIRIQPIKMNADPDPEHCSGKCSFYLVCVELHGGQSERIPVVLPPIPRRRKKI